MKWLVGAAVLWLAAALPSHATVLVYKGTGVNYTQTSVGNSATEGCYLILDLNLGEMTLIYYNTFAHQKYLWIPINQDAFDDVSVNGANGKVYQIFADVGRTVAGPAYSDLAAVFRGLNSTEKIAGSPGSYGTAAYPHSLEGTYRYVEGGFGSTYAEHAFSLIFDQTVTVNSNNGSLGIAAVQANIIGVVESAGYQP